MKVGSNVRLQNLGKVFPGHIPHSRNVPRSQLVDVDVRALRPKDQLEQILNKRIGLSKSKMKGTATDGNIVCSCGNGVLASIVALALHEVGVENAAVYDGSLFSMPRPKPLRSAWETINQFWYRHHVPSYDLSSIPSGKSARTYTEQLMQSTDHGETGWYRSIRIKGTIVIGRRRDVVLKHVESAKSRKNDCSPQVADENYQVVQTNIGGKITSRPIMSELKIMLVNTSAVETTHKHVLDV